MKPSQDHSRVNGRRLAAALFVACLAFGTFGASGDWDANLSDFPRRAGETDDSPRFMRAVGGGANMAADAARLFAK